LDHPFFGHLALGMGIQQETRGRTRSMGTNGRTIYYDMEFVDRTPHDDLVTCVAHEVMHAALLHHTRRLGRDVDRWNDAGDFAINPLLKAAGFKMPAWLYLDPKFEGMTTERIYDLLQQQEPDEPDEPGSDNAPGGGSPGAPPPDGGNDSGDVHDNQDGNTDKPGAVWDSPDPAQEEAEWQVAVKQATQIASMMGRLPAGMSCAVEQATRPRIDWKSILRRFVQQFASADYSWRRPNPRYVAGGIYLPELRAEAMPPIIVAVDTSASTRRVLPVFKGELQSIVDECQPEATIVIMADAAVHRVDRFERGDPIEFNVEGLGGTDFRPVFEHVHREQLSPACLIYLTDGEGHFPDEPSEYPTLWAITTPQLEAPWGETVTIDELEVMAA
jgi:predicted metal-dependent peptidase